MFGGYPWFRDAHGLSGEAFPWSGSLELRAGVLKRRVREKLNIHKYVREALSEAVGRVEHLPHESADGRCLRTMQHLCFEFFMANLQERALTMCEHSHVAVLTPFADERLMQYVYNVPWEMKFLGGREKGLLREAAGALLPESLRYRRKSPYPKTCDPEYARIVCGMVQGMLAEKAKPAFAVGGRAGAGEAGRLGPLPHEGAVVRPTDGRTADAGLSLAGEYLAARPARGSGAVSAAG